MTRVRVSWFTHCLVGFLSCLSLSVAYAQSNLEKAAQILDQQARRGKGEFITYLTGAASAYRWSAMEAEKAGRPRPYCPPPKDSLDGRAYGKLALQEYRQSRAQYAAASGYPLDVLSLALLHALRREYPCERNTAVEVTPRAE